MNIIAWAQGQHRVERWGLRCSQHQHTHRHRQLRHFEPTGRQGFLQRCADGRRLPGAGLQALIDEKLWTDRADLAAAYVTWGAYAYGAKTNGINDEKAFTERLRRIEAVVHNQDNREHDLLDSDDYYQFEGGMTAAVEQASGVRPRVYHNDHSRPDRPVVRTLEEEVGRVMRSRVVNPKWIDGVKRHGYKGAFEIAATVDYMFAFAATTGAVRPHHFDLAYDAFLADDATRHFIRDNNPAALREIAVVHQGDFRLTANQNLIIANVSTENRPRFEALLRRHRLDTANEASGLKLNALSCVALPTCGLALAESERYLPELVSLLEQEFAAAGLARDAVTLRITGCPNGCGRPFLAEIGLVGKSPGKYNLYLGAAFDGSRLNTLYRANVVDSEIAGLLRPIIQRYAAERNPGEHFGDFTVRAGYVTPTGTPRDFHEAKASA